MTRPRDRLGSLERGSASESSALGSANAPSLELERLVLLCCRDLHQSQCNDDSERVLRSELRDIRRFDAHTVHAHGLDSSKCDISSRHEHRAQVQPMIGCRARDGDALICTRVGYALESYGDPKRLRGHSE